MRQPVVKAAHYTSATWGVKAKFARARAAPGRGVGCAPSWREKVPPLASGEPVTDPKATGVHFFEGT